MKDSLEKGNLVVEYNLPYTTWLKVPLQGGRGDAGKAVEHFRVSVSICDPNHVRRVKILSYPATAIVGERIIE